MVKVDAFGKRISDAQKVDKLGKRIVAQHSVLFEVYHQPIVFDNKRLEDSRIVVLRQTAEVGIAAKVVQQIRADCTANDVRPIGLVVFQDLDDRVLQALALEDPADGG